MNNAILLVEDNPSDEKLTLLAFNRCGISHEMTVARDGAEALDYLLARGEHAGRDVSLLPSVMLLDLKLPKVNGLEVLRRVREDERTKLLPVVVLTASREDQDVSQSFALGCNAYVRKPVEFAEFTKVAQTLASFWLTLNECPRAVRSAP